MSRRKFIYVVIVIVHFFRVFIIMDIRDLLSCAPPDVAMRKFDSDTQPDLRTYTYNQKSVDYLRYLQEYV